MTNVNTMFILVMLLATLAGSKLENVAFDLKFVLMCSKFR